MQYSTNGFNPGMQYSANGFYPGRQYSTNGFYPGMQYSTNGYESAGTAGGPLTAYPGSHPGYGSFPGFGAYVPGAVEPLAIPTAYPDSAQLSIYASGPHSVGVQLYPQYTVYGY